MNSVNYYLIKDNKAFKLPAKELVLSSDCCRSKLLIHNQIFYWIKLVPFLQSRQETGIIVKKGTRVNIHNICVISHNEKIDIIEANELYRKYINTVDIQKEINLIETHNTVSMIYQGRPYNIMP